MEFASFWVYSEFYFTQLKSKMIITTHNGTKTNELKKLLQI